MPPLVPRARPDRRPAALPVLGLAVVVLAVVVLAVVPPAGGAPAAARGAALARSAGVPALQPAAGMPPRVAGAPVPRPVVLAGLAGLRWADLTAARMPALWRLARAGAIGSLSVTGLHPLTCRADGWLTLNAANRAAAPRPAGGGCPRLPAVIPAAPAASAAPGDSQNGPRPARVAGFRWIVAANAALRQNPSWGLLRAAAGPGRCATAVGPGAALALATPAGRVPSYLPGVGSLGRPVTARAVLARCPLTVIDLGTLPGAAGPRRAAVRAADREIARISAVLPSGTRLVVTAPADVAVPHLHPIVITGPGFGPGLLASPSTRQPGLAVLTDLATTIAGWLGRPVPGTVVGVRLRAARRPSLAAAVTGLARQDIAAQVYRTTMPAFFTVFGLAAGALFGMIIIVPWGPGASRARRRRVLARAAGVLLASVPAASFLAGLVPWPGGPHPAAVLYGATLAWATVLAATAVCGPWRRDPLGAPGFVGAATVAVIGIDLMTGSHLQRDAPFGISPLVAGRFYGLGNNAVLVYAASGLLACGWIGSAALRRGARLRAVAGMGAVAAAAAVAAGWPGFGAKVGGTIAMVPAFLLLVAAAAGVRVTVARGLLMAVAGAALAAAFAVAGYLMPEHSDIGAFVGQVLHGGAAAVVHRKIRANLASLTMSAGLAIPVVVAVSGVVIGWPAAARAGPLARGYRRLPLLRPLLAAIWLAGLLGWLADDSGVTVIAAGLPFILPLVVAILAATPAVAPTSATPAVVAAGEPGYL